MKRIDIFNKIKHELLKNVALKIYITNEIFFIRFAR